MICYKDMTFCNSDCTNSSCKRKLTDEIFKEAKDWWGDDGAPVAISDFSKSCEEYEQ